MLLLIRSGSKSDGAERLVGMKVSQLCLMSDIFTGNNKRGIWMRSWKGREGEGGGGGGEQENAPHMLSASSATLHVTLASPVTCQDSGHPDKPRCREVLHGLGAGWVDYG